MVGVDVVRAGHAADWKLVGQRLRPLLRKNLLVADLVGLDAATGVGAVAGALVVCGIVMLDKLKIDDPVGAWPVHGLCGIWGGIATALFSDSATLGVQLLGSAVYAVWAFVTMFGVFYILKVAGILRVSEAEELEGLDISDHGAVNYPEFGPSLSPSPSTD